MADLVIDISSRYRAAAAALDRGEPAETRRICRELISAHPSHADSHFLLGMADAHEGQIGRALDAVRNAIRIHAQPAYLAQLARLLVLARRDGEALAAADQAAALEPDDALTLDTIGGVYSRVGAHSKAVPFFARAVARHPHHAQMRFNYAAALGFIGRFSDAELEYEAAIALNPRFVKAHSALSAVRTQTAECNHVARLESLLSLVGDGVDSLHLHYALAKEHEDLGHPRAVFEHLDTANRRRRAQLAYTIDFDRSIFDALMQHFDDPRYFAGAGEHDEAPLFVVGMPRTGTTLVDRILSSHPLVESAGELQIMQLALKRLTGTRTRYGIDPTTIEAAARLTPSQLGRSYLANSAPYRKSQRRFIDKLPLNFLYVGDIARALPQAKIICLRRHPLDTVWSNFRHLFATQFSYYNYSYDLLDTATYYVMFDRLMSYWQQRIPGRVLEVRYEAIVDDLETQARRLLAHCDLGWSDRCLSFHENDAAVATPSATQVRQPIYRGARGRWRKYEEYLIPARRYLEAHGIQID
jgi:tetratricopeptide (TPR) repeat protein